MTRLRRALLLGAAAAAMATLPACIVSSSNKVRSSGRYIGDQTIARIEPNKTDRKWILAVLGEPTSKSALDDGVELWKWEYMRVKTSSGSVLFVAAGNDREETIRNVYVEFKGDIVSQVWRD